MIIPIRCMSCGKPLAHLQEEFNAKKEKDMKKALDEAGVKRHCCRATLMGHVDLMDVAAEFKRT